MHTKTRFALALAALAVVLVPTIADAQGKKGTQKIDSKGERAVRAATIDFPATYNLSLEGLATVGARIDQVRLNPDPVALALIATELDAAEKVSGKQAGITAADLRKEAIDMAKRRADAKELKVVALLINDAAASKDLQELSEKAADRDAQAKAGEKTRGIGTLTVQNFTAHKIWIYVNDSQVGWVNPFGQYTFTVNQPGFNTTKLFGRSSNNVTTWGPRYLAEDYSSFTWNMY